MITTTISLSISGGSHEELLAEATSRLAEYFNISPDDVHSRVSFDLVVSVSNDGDYAAEITAKAKERV